MTGPPMEAQTKLTPSVVLVTDRTLSGNYKVIFEAMLATMQTTQVPRPIMTRLLCPRVPTDPAGRASAASISIRRVESCLLARTDLTADDVVCVTPESLDKVLGPWVKIVGVSSSDPLGRGMSNTTTSAFWPGRLYTALWTDQMMQRIGRAKDRWGFTVIAGGGGAWQWARDRDAASRQGIDVIYEGYFESQGPQLVTDILAGRPAPDHVRADRGATDAIEPITAPAVLGMVELSRGCGKGCSFCPMAAQRMEHVAPETILSDLETNIAGGQRSVVSGSEDFFRYGGRGSKVNFEALRSLLERMGRVGGLRFMQIDHANVSSVLQLSVEELRELRRLMRFEQDVKYLWVNMGIETASPRLLRSVSAGKAAPFALDDWEEMVLDAAARMAEAGFFPVFSVVLGLPGETPDDVARTLKLVRQLDRRPIVVFPIFYEPLPGPDGQVDTPFSLDSMTPAHLELYTTCYEINFRRIPPLFWDNQRAGGVNWFKRVLLQLLGRGEMRMWRKAFKRLRKAQSL